MLIYSLEEYIELNGYPIHPAAREFLRKFPDYGEACLSFPYTKGVWGFTTDLRRVSPRLFRKWREAVQDVELSLKTKLCPIGACGVTCTTTLGCFSLLLLADDGRIYLLDDWSVLFKTPRNVHEIQNTNQLCDIFSGFTQVFYEYEDDTDTIVPLPVVQLSVSQHLRMMLTYLAIDLRDQYPNYTLALLGLGFLYWIIF